MTAFARTHDRLIPSLRRRLRLLRYSDRTADVYVSWVRRFVRFHGSRHAREMGEAEVAGFLSALAVDGRVSAGTQNQALAALLFLYRDVLGVQLAMGRDIVRARRPKRLPVVMTAEEVWRVLEEMDGPTRLAALLMYGSGLRLMEVLALRVKDVDFSAGEILVRGGKGNKDRRTMLPRSVVEPLRQHLARARRLFERDRANGLSPVELPDALARKYPHASREWGWQCLAKRATCHTFRHSFATQLIQAGYDIRTVQELLGHTDVRTTMIYTHVLNMGGYGVRSPADISPEQNQRPRRLSPPGRGALLRQRLRSRALEWILMWPGRRRPGCFSCLFHRLIALDGDNGSHDYCHLN